MNSPVFQKFRLWIVPHMLVRFIGSSPVFHRTLCTHHPSEAVIAVLLLTLAEHISLPVVSIADDLWLCRGYFCVFIFPTQFLQTVAVIVAVRCNFLLRFPPDTVACGIISQLFRLLPRIHLIKALAVYNNTFT